MKTETMVVEALYQVNTHREFVFIFVAPYENQIRQIFNRIRELVTNSPLLQRRMVRSINNPYLIEFLDNSRILGFTTGASSNSGGASIRGQRANMIACDEMDYLGEGDFENITMLAAEREDIRICVSSTPTGKRGDFYNICTNPKIGYSLHHHPSTHNPNWSEVMEAEFRSQLSELGYIHEVLAEFGTQDTGVFNKDCLDKAIKLDNYAYNELTNVQKIRLERTGDEMPIMYTPIGGKFKRNIFRTMGVDWDKYGASSSILILDYDEDFGKFRVLKRVEVPKSEYSYDNAVNLIVELNDIYNPSWIYVDRGSGEYQIERLHILGDENKASGLKNKVKGWQFKEKIQVPDAAQKVFHEEPLKPFMVNQLTIAFERQRIILSPYDEVLYKQLIDYEVERISQSGLPIYTSKNEHFIDALGLAYLAFVLEFPNLTGAIKEITHTSKMEFISSGFREQAAQRDLSKINRSQFKNPWDNMKIDYSELPGDRPTYYKNPTYKPSKNFLKADNNRFSGNWGSRSSLGNDRGYRFSW